MRPFAYDEPADVAEAVALLRSEGDGARPIAGGSDLLGELKEGSVRCARLVSLGRIAALRGIREHEGGLRLGAAVTLAELEGEARLRGPWSILAEAARGIATPEIRNQGTLGGNLCQRPRCLHYRSGWIPCLKKGGPDCPAAVSAHQPYLSVFGGAGCYAAHASDLAPALLALGAEAVVAGPEGERRLALADFFAGPERDVRRENVLAAGELLAAVIVPAPPPHWRGTYRKARERSAGDFPLASVAFGCAVDGGTLRHVRVVLGGVAPVPRPCPEAEAVLEGAAASPEVAARAADAAFADARPLPHNAYKVALGRALLARTVVQTAG